MEIGRVCIKLSGREAGKYCIVLKNIDKTFVSITGPRVLTGVKRRKCNVAHLQPTEYKLEITEDSSEENVLEAWNKSGLVKKFDLKKPPAAEIKTIKTEVTAETEKKTKEKEKKTK